MNKHKNTAWGCIPAAIALILVIWALADFPAFW